MKVFLSAAKICLQCKFLHALFCLDQVLSVLYSDSDLMANRDFMAVHFDGVLAYRKASQPSDAAAVLRDLNGEVDIYDLGIFLSAWQTSFGQPGWNGRCDLAEPKDMRIDLSDFAVFASQWQEKEEWYIGSD